MVKTEMVPYATASVLADAYQRNKKRVVKALEEAKEALEELNSVYRNESMIGDFEVHVSTGYGAYSTALDDQMIERIQQEFKRKAWSLVIQKLDIRKIMPTNEQEKLDKALSRDRDSNIDALPELTSESIMSVASAYIQSAPELLDEKIRELYRQLVPRSRQWGTGNLKTNKLDRLASKIIIGYVVQQGYGSPFRVIYNRTDLVSNLHLIMSLLDGQGIPSEHNGELYAAIQTSQDGTGSTKYFRFKCCKNGNLHLWFLRKDLLDRFNQIACEGSRSVGSE